jgi:hypothetical protein
MVSTILEILYSKVNKQLLKKMGILVLVIINVVNPRVWDAVTLNINN